MSIDEGPVLAVGGTTTSEIPASLCRAPVMCVLALITAHYVAGGNCRAADDLPRRPHDRGMIADRVPRWGPARSSFSSWPFANVFVDKPHARKAAANQLVTSGAEVLADREATPGFMSGPFRNAGGGKTSTLTVFSIRRIPATTRSPSPRAFPCGPVRMRESVRSNLAVARSRSAGAHHDRPC